MAAVELTRFETSAMAALLAHCYHDGVVFVRSRDDRKLLKKALTLGLVDARGAVTPCGAAFRTAWTAWSPTRSSQGAD